MLALRRAKRSINTTMARAHQLRTKHGHLHAPKHCGRRVLQLTQKPPNVASDVVDGPKLQYAKRGCATPRHSQPPVTSESRDPVHRHQDEETRLYVGEVDEVLADSHNGSDIGTDSKQASVRFGSHPMPSYAGSATAEPDQLVSERLLHLLAGAPRSR